MSAPVLYDQGPHDSQTCSHADEICTSPYGCRRCGTFDDSPGGYMFWSADRGPTREIAEVILCETCGTWWAGLPRPEAIEWARARMTR